jgi:hypothetical protein
MKTYTLYTVSFDGYTNSGNAKHTLLLVDEHGNSRTVKTKPNICYGGFSFAQGFGVKVRAEIKLVRDTFMLTYVEAVK